MKICLLAKRALPAQVRGTLNRCGVSFKWESVRSLSSEPGHDPMDLNEGLTGFPIVWLRATNILDAMSEGKPFLKTLYAYCEEVLPAKFGRKSNVELIGCTDDEINAETCRKMKQYAKVDVVDFTKQFPYSRNSFGGIFCLRPPYASLDKPLFNIESLLSLVGDGGFVIIGMTEAEIEHHNVFDRIEQIEKNIGVALVAVQHIDCRPEDMIPSNPLEKIDVAATTAVSTTGTAAAPSSQRYCLLSLLNNPMMALAKRKK